MNSNFSAHICLKTTCLIGCITLIGCGSQPEPPAPPRKTDKPQARQPAPLQAQPAAPKNDSIITAPVDYIGASIRAGNQTKGTVELIQIRKAIESYQEREGGKNPESLEELVATKDLNMIPVAPSGQQLSYDASTGTIKLVPKQNNP